MYSADQLAQEVGEARLAEFGPDSNPDTGEQYPARYASKYFNRGVYVIAPNGQLTPRAPKYCASNVGAARVSNVLSDAGFPCSVKLGAAMELTDSWQDTEPVPILVFKRATDDERGPYTGAKVNAGLLLDYFNHGYPGKRCLASCKLEVLDAQAANGEIKPLEEEERQAIMNA